MRACQFRREMGHGLRMAWALMLQYRSTDLNYFYRDSLSQLPSEALGIRYQIELSGSGDNYNRVLVYQKAQGHFTAFRGDPFINQYELRRNLLEADNPALVKALLLDAGQQSADQQEDQAQEISIMLLGYAAQVKQTDDDLAHIKSIAGFVKRRKDINEHMSAETLRLLAQHVQQHLGALKQKQPDTYKGQSESLLTFSRELQNEAAHAAQQEQIAMGGEPPSQSQGGIAA
jgi:hypothetical protein